MRKQVPEGGKGVSERVWRGNQENEKFEEGEYCRKLMREQADIFNCLNCFVLYKVYWVYVLDSFVWMKRLWWYVWDVYSYQMSFNVFFFLIVIFLREVVWKSFLLKNSADWKSLSKEKTFSFILKSRLNKFFLKKIHCQMKFTVTVKVFFFVFQLRLLSQIPTENPSSQQIHWRWIS